MVGMVVAVGMVLGGDRLSVEFVDNVDVGVVDGCNRG